MTLIIDGAADHAHADVLGVAVSAINMQEALALADAHIRSGARGYVCVTGVHGVMEAQGDRRFLRILNSAMMNAPDGMPMSWVGRLQGHKTMNRVYGPDFMLEMCRLSVSRGYKQFFYGGQKGVVDLLASKLVERFAGLKVVGKFTPPFRPLTAEEEQELFAEIETSRPDIVWVGLSTPKQERFMADYVNLLGVPLLVGVGAAFDINTGRIKDAPLWMKRSGLQWVHRLIQEPSRLGRRYLINNPQFVFKIVRQLLGTGHPGHSSS